MFKKVKLLVIVSALTLFVGCATIIGGGSTQKVNFDSAPAGASIFVGKLEKDTVVDLVNTGEVTPHTLEISRKNVVVIFKKEGFKDTNVVLKTSINGWFFGNIIVGGILGSSIDSSTGAMNKYDPDNFFVEMEKE